MRAVEPDVQPETRNLPGRLGPFALARLASDALGPSVTTGVVAVMTAVGLCESGGNPRATAQAVNGTAYGLWQQNEGIGSGLFDPAVAARHMADTYRQSGYQYWGCGPAHRSGYLPFMAVALPAAVAARRSSGGSTTPGPFAPVANLAVSTAVYGAIKARFPSVTSGGICCCRHERGTGSNPSLWSVHSVCGAVDVWPSSSVSAAEIVAFAKGLPAVWDAWLDDQPGDVHVQVIPNPPAGWVPNCTPGPAGTCGHIPMVNRGGGGTVPKPVPPQKVRPDGTCPHGTVLGPTPPGTTNPGLCCPPGMVLGVSGGILGGFLCVDPSDPAAQRTSTGSPLDLIGGWVGDLLRGVLPFLKVGAGGVLLLGGLAVLVIGATGGTPAVVAAAEKVPGVRAQTRVARRRALGTEVRRSRSEAATEEARARVVTREGRVRVVRRRQGLANAAQDRAAEAEARDTRAQAQRARLADLRSERTRRRRSPPLASASRRA